MPPAVAEASRAARSRALTSSSCHRIASRDRPQRALRSGSRQTTLSDWKRSRTSNACYTRRTTDVEAGDSHRPASARRPREVGANPTRCRHCKRGAPSPEPVRPAATARPAILTGPKAWEGWDERDDPRARIPGAGPSFSHRRETRREGVPCDSFVPFCVLFHSSFLLTLGGTPRSPAQSPAASSIRTAARSPGATCARSSTARRSSPARSPTAPASSRSQRPAEGAFECASRSRASAPSRSPSTRRPTPRDLGTLTLEVSAISESIVVSASQVEIPLSTDVVERDGDQRRRARDAPDRHSVADALRSVPGLWRRRIRRPRRDDRRVPARRRIRLLAGRYRRRAGQRVRRRLRLRAPADREHRPHRDRARPAERAVRLERDRLGRSAS